MRQKLEAQRLEAERLKKIATAEKLAEEKLAAAARKEKQNELKLQKTDSVKILLDLAKDRDVLGMYLAAISSLDNAEVKTISESVRRNAISLSKISPDMADEKLTINLDKFVWELSSVTAFFALYVNDQNGKLIKLEGSNFEKAKAVINAWYIKVDAISRLENFKEEQTRQKLVQLIREIESGIEIWQDIPGL